MQGNRQTFADARELLKRGPTGTHVVFRVYFDERRWRRIFEERLEVNGLETDADLRGQVGARRAMRNTIIRCGRSDVHWRVGNRPESATGPLRLARLELHQLAELGRRSA